MTGCHFTEKRDCVRPIADVDRRRFLFGAGAAVVWVSLPGTGRRVQAQVVEYPRQESRHAERIGREEIDREFRYPVDDPNATNVLAATRRTGRWRRRCKRVMSSRSIRCARTWAGRWTAHSMGKPVPQAPARCIGRHSI